MRPRFLTGFPSDLAWAVSQRWLDARAADGLNRRRPHRPAVADAAAAARLTHRRQQLVVADVAA